MSTERKPPIVYLVMSGSTPTPCKADECQQPIYWIEQNGTRIPVDCEPDTQAYPWTAPLQLRPPSAHHTASAASHGRGVNHFATCIAKDRFKTANRHGNSST